MVLHYTTLVPPLMSCIGPPREVGLSTGMWRGHVPLVKKERRRRCIENTKKFWCKLAKVVCEARTWSNQLLWPGRWTSRLHTQHQNRSEKSPQAHITVKCPLCHNTLPRCQRSRSRDAENRFGGLVAASFSTLLGQLPFLVLYYTVFSGNLTIVSLLSCYKKLTNLNENFLLHTFLLATV